MSASDSGQVRIEKDIVFGRGGDMDLHLDIYRPLLASKKLTAVIELYGGAFVGGNKDRMSFAAELFARRGYVCIPSSIGSPMRRRPAFVGFVPTLATLASTPTGSWLQVIPLVATLPLWPQGRPIRRSLRVK